MAERPILFTGPMVRAILDGSKTQTRRVVKPQPEFAYSGTFRLRYEKHPFSPSAFVGTAAEGRVGGEERNAWVSYDWIDNPVGVAEADEYRCPYGVPGDLLYVREMWRYHNWTEDGIPRIQYAADGALVWHEDTPEDWAERLRLWLRVTDVRVERVQDITEDDMVAEGIDPDAYADATRWEEVAMGFRSLWDSINEKRGFGWDVNPWVWAVTFEKVDR